MKTLDNMKIPVIQGGMGIGISMGNLAGHVAKEGGMGVISTANTGFREPDFWENPDEANERALRAEIRKAREIAQGNGMIAINAMVATCNFEKMIKAACDEGIDAVICGAGLPLELPKITDGKDVLIAPIVSSSKAAKMIKKVWETRYGRKADFYVVEGSNAGGHLGFKQDELEKGTAQPLEEIVREVAEEAGQIPVFAAGSVFDADEIKEMLAAGAYGVQIATRFIATEECDATDGYKQMILNADADQVTILKSPVGMPGRGLETPLIKDIKAGKRFQPENCIGCIRTCNPAETPYCISRALIDSYYGKEETGLFFCGSNVGRINEITTVKELMEELSAGWE